MKLAALVALIGYPIGEIALLIKAGGILGVWALLAVIVLTGIIGANLIRSSGMSALSRVFASIEEGGSGLSVLADQALRAAGGLLLLLPGLMGDVLGAALLVPPVRTLVRKAFAGLLGVRLVRTKTPRRSGARDVPRHSASGRTQPPVIEGDYVRIDNDPAKDAGKN